MVAMSETSTGVPLLTVTIVWAMSAMVRIWPTLRITADWVPRLTVLAPTLMFAPFSASITCFSVIP